MIKFPDEFLWGSATAGHQIEGGNVNSDCWAAEMAPGSFFKEPSGDACDGYHRYVEDIGLLANAGLNAYRFSVEWARIEPDPGWFSIAALDHYRRVLAACHERDVTPIVTYNHFTTPYWFAARGGWAQPDSADLFARYCDRVTNHLGDLIPWACTLNEPNLMSALTHIGIAPVGDGDLDTQDRTKGDLTDWARMRELSGRVTPRTLPGFQFVELETIAAAHRKAAATIRSGRGNIRVGWTLALIDVQAVEGGEARSQAAKEAAQLSWLDVSKDDDFIGVQTYSRERMGSEGLVARPADAPLMLTGWEVYPQALANTVRMAWARAGVPILVTENGCATADDAQRISYTADALKGLGAAIEDGVDVRGYLHWTLLDNFEWHSGFDIFFGLIAVDRTTFDRTPKASLAWLGNVAGKGGPQGLGPS